MEIKKINEKIYFFLNLQDLKKMNINIHNILTNCDIETYLETFFSSFLDKKNVYKLTSCTYFKNVWTICLETCQNQNFSNKKEQKKVIKKYATLKSHTYTNLKLKKDIIFFKDFYDYLQHSIYSKYVSIKNGIIFIKDKSKEKYILNYLSEYE